ncbi:glutamine synthetase family protein [Streptomyces meridianus]|uniref:Glutamine synthetase family protein n=1 Tax=Streptomyces meridianus TaxID=2938945 RepID=A0ABT0X1B2_9ACTN|nr:glutamine synthetase family protein [Streptomyces meridianus]MCM2576346.1 glutamine synthetase family protein [Streptomyces meridianus]
MPATAQTTAHGASQHAQRSGLLTVEDLRREADAGWIGEVMLALPDPQGRLKGKRYGAQHFLKHVLDEGAEMCAYVLATDIDMRPLPGFALTSWETGYQDLRLRVDGSTIRRLPWEPGTALVHADAIDPRSGQQVAVSPRTMLRRQLDRLAACGLSAKVGLETEFVLYHGAAENQTAAGHRPLRPVASDNLDYALDHNPPTCRYLHALRTQLAGAGLPVEALKTEGAPGQVEITFPYGDPLAACDGHTVFKHAARAIAAEAGLAPTFMAAPQTGVASGLHVHLSLWKGEQPVLDEGEGPSRLAHHAIGGLLEALPDLAPLYAPTINSYKRYAPESFAPTHFNWGVDNRTCAVRVVGHGKGLHLEVRLPGADANPYLALAAVVAAIGHGIDLNLPAGAASTGNAYRASDATPIPATLADALAVFRRSELAEHAFGSSVVAHYARLAEIEVETDRFAVSDLERARGLTRS